MKATIVEEVRHTREQHAAKFRLNLKAIVADAKRRQRLPGHKLLSFANAKPAGVPCDEVDAEPPVTLADRPEAKVVPMKI